MDEVGREQVELNMWAEGIGEKASALAYTMLHWPVAGNDQLRSALNYIGLL